MRFTRARTKCEAIVTAITEFNRRRRMAELAKRAGTCTTLMTVDELQQMRNHFLRTDGDPVVRKRVESVLHAVADQRA